ncbi:glycosyltransferase family 2 protein [Flavobacterium gilvum]|uniref:dTDP-Rha--alpha-D-GlcNAc-pyrophosphate polyprenol alpha-3-L-rhamnosyltransferase n=1 Tax=Flavobacterium gilvum TaxID=1492737 RepID=A0AAC9N6W0_9FLAO|nr:glycosyltransferase family 2 protein [Flavobacterium gilvum]AOW10154.1 dTDP-Rha--alpha-D-GlcNAc-pyrophosphate polyprenol alpha-3-L-rhamnosyltransferase [Flavobacterium gilvum]KFC59444.1 glycosyl transferase family 2 [Flavobacterium gilvum]
MKKIAVVILNWNGVKLLEQFLPSVSQFSPEATIYVADNASTDESIQFVKNNFPDIKIIQNNSNKGFAGGYNEALQQVEEEIYALVNSDIEVTENWLNPILKTFSDEIETAIIQPKILDFKKKNYFEYAGAAGGFIDKFGYPFCRGRIFDTLEKDNGQYNDAMEIFWASGACFFIRKNVYREMKGFDEDFFAHQEEIDLCWRTINKGYKIKYCPESIVYHVGGATLQQANPKKTFLNFRNSLLMLTKNLPKNELFQILVARLFLDGVAGVKFIAGGQFVHCLAIIRGHFSFYGLFLKNYRKREKNQIETYFKIKSVVYGYYIKNGTVFADYI